MTTFEVACQDVCTAWATVADVCEPCSDYAIDTTLLDHNLLIASNILFHLSGKRYPGICTDTVRPALRSLTRDYGRPIRPPYPFGGPYGYWPPASAGYAGSPAAGFWMTNRTDRSGTQIVPEITLGAYPLVAINEVKIDGEVLDPSLYRIDDSRWLVRKADANGNNPGWPGTQDFTKDATELGTWQVSFDYGSLPDAGGVRACAELACQLTLACTPRLVGQCRLPSRVTSLTRQGMSMVVIDPYEFIDKGRTGLYFVDLWLSTVNPGGTRQRARVMSADIRRRVRRAGTGGFS